MNKDQNIIMFVGPDMCGKTQIAKAASQVLNIPYFKATSEHNTYLQTKDQFVTQLRVADPRMVDFLQQTGHSVIFDRAYPCEFSYSKVFRRKTDHNMLVYLDSQYAKMGTRIIVCHRSSYKGIIDDIDNKIQADVLQRLHNAYMDFCAWTRCDVLCLNVDDENLEREIRDIQGWLVGRVT